MGTHESDAGAATSAVTMDDLKELKISLTSSMETQMSELREMMAQILKASKAPAPTLPEDSTSAARDKASALSVGEKAGDEEPHKDSPPKRDSGKEGYHEVPHWYSPDPPIPHPI